MTFPQMNQFVTDHVVRQPDWELQQSPVEQHAAIPSAGIFLNA
jgi:hypothetical protein